MINTFTLDLSAYEDLKAFDAIDAHAASCMKALKEARKNKGGLTITYSPLFNVVRSNNDGTQEENLPQEAEDYYKTEEVSWQAANAIEEKDTTDSTSKYIAGYMTDEEFQAALDKQDQEALKRYEEMRKKRREKLHAIAKKKPQYKQVLVASAAKTDNFIFSMYGKVIAFFDSLIENVVEWASKALDNIISTFSDTAQLIGKFFTSLFNSSLTDLLELQFTVLPVRNQIDNDAIEVSFSGLGSKQRLVPNNNGISVYVENDLTSSIVVEFYNKDTEEYFVGIQEVNTANVQDQISILPNYEIGIV